MARLIPVAAKAPTSIARNQVRPAFPLKDPRPGSSLKTWFSFGSVFSSTNFPPTGAPRIGSTAMAYHERAQMPLRSPTSTLTLPLTMVAL
jgi:hypothetical protein